MTQNFEKNPNGGYLNKSNYGEDSWYGSLTITPELIAKAQATGKVLVEVKDIQVTQYGECRRAVFKEYVPAHAPMSAQPMQQSYAPAQPAQRPVQQQPAYAPQAPAPVQHAQAAPIQDDNIPF
jgi:hypothetical protein